MLRSLFGAMTKGGLFGADLIERFNGGLFDADDTIPLQPDEIKGILSVARLDWSSIEPSVFGTLFERGLDPSKRSQLGAHYTDAQSIMRIVHPVVVDPLAATWNEAKNKIEAAVKKAVSAKSASARTYAYKEAEAIYSSFLHHLSGFRVLDPACGSGNFLYLALQSLKDLEHRAMLEAEQLGLPSGFVGMNVGVQCLRGIEINSYAAELARVTVWIGEIQWMLRHGVPPSKNPILQPLETIECRDAVITENGTESEWPKADVIVGNPPFLGNKKMIRELSESYTENLRQAYKGRVPAGADLVIYWFEKALSQIKKGHCRAAGLVGTQSIRKGANRFVLDQIASRTRIFNAWQDQPWVNEGAAVRVSLVCYGEGGAARLNDVPVAGINADLSPTKQGLNVTKAKRLNENTGIAFQGPVKVGAFDISGDVARKWLLLPNPDSRKNCDVLKRWANGRQITGRPSDAWIIDFGPDMLEDHAALYEAPFQHVVNNVKAARLAQRDVGRKERWWLHGRTGDDFRAALAPLSRFIATSRVAKHRVFVWLSAKVWPDSRLYAICRDDDFTFGTLSSRIHVVWALAQASRHGVGNDPTYNAKDCFETFPFPKPDKPSRELVVIASKRLNELRENWLNPSDWVDRVPDVVVGYPDRIVAKPGHDTELKKRTMTALYNTRPSWLVNAHRDLDAAVAAAYGWPDYTLETSDEEILRRLLELNLTRPSRLNDRAT